MNKKLYIIGNGFDLHHGIASRYSDFGKFLKDKHSETYDFVERYFDITHEFWFEFEERLADFDVDSLIDDASMFLVGYGADEWSDSYHHDYQYEINRATKAISETMRKNFAEWVRQLKIPDSTKISDKLLKIDNSATFLNFNYTPTLNKLYNVQDTKVMHIHGSATSPTSPLILGHGWEPEETKQIIDDPESIDVRVLEGQDYINDYFSETFKPTEKILKQENSFFSSLRDIDEIMVLGHSLSEVDRSYFFEIIKYIKSSSVRWKVSYYGDVEKAKNNFSIFNIADNLVEFREMKDFK